MIKITWPDIRALLLSAGLGRAGRAGLGWDIFRLWLCKIGVVCACDISREL